MIRVALVDDHQLFRKSLSLLISSFRDMEVVYDTHDGLAFLDSIATSSIDVVLLDIQMPLIDGYEVCRRLHAADASVKILIVSQLTSTEAIHQIMECGANGFFTKNSDPELLEAAIRSVMANDYYFDMELTSVIREAVLWEESTSAAVHKSEKVKLTSREVEIIMLACRQMSSVEIGDRLCISDRTVEKHRKRIMEKTGCKNFIGVVLFALKNNAFKLEDI